MLKISNVEVFGWEAAIRGMRNPLNSWDKSDTVYYHCNEFAEDCYDCIGYDNGDMCDKLVLGVCVGNNDLSLMKKLGNAGPDHGKYLRMINVTLDIYAPLYWWKEFDTYKVGTVANSRSTMHKIHARPFEIDDFSHENLTDSAMHTLYQIMWELNAYRGLFIDTKKKEYWWNMIQLLPSSYNQLRTVQLNYQVLKSMYHARKAHKLDEWHTFCDWVETLPYSELITNK